MSRGMNGATQLYQKQTVHGEGIDGLERPSRIVHQLFSGHTRNGFMKHFRANLVT